MIGRLRPVIQRINLEFQKIEGRKAVLTRGITCKHPICVQMLVREVLQCELLGMDLVHGGAGVSDRPHLIGVADDSASPLQLQPEADGHAELRGPVQHLPAPAQLMDMPPSGEM